MNCRDNVTFRLFNEMHYPLIWTFPECQKYEIKKKTRKIIGHNINNVSQTQFPMLAVCVCECKVLFMCWLQ